MTVGALVLAAGYCLRFCLRPGDSGLPAELGLEGLDCIECRDASRGMGATLAAGVRACADWDGLLVVLGDMAWVAPATFNAVAAAVVPDRIVQPVCNGRGGHPVGFGSDFFPALAGLDGDRGARSVIEQNPAALVPLQVRDPGIFRDLDEPTELR